MLSLLNGNDLSFSGKSNSFSQERLCCWPHFESEDFWNLELSSILRPDGFNTVCGVRGGEFRLVMHDVYLASVEKS